MKWRYGLLICCAILITAAGVAAESSLETPWVCCESEAGCGASETCCPPDVVGKPPCGQDNPGYCMDACVRAFTPDRK
jgi:hypothetical protein